MTAATIAHATGERLAAAESAGLNATLHWSQRLLDAEAARVEAQAPAGRSGAMPIGVKDNIVTTEQPTTCASRILEGYTSPFTATAVDRLRAAGAMVAAKANMDEFAMGSSTEHSAYRAGAPSPGRRPRSRRLAPVVGGAGGGGRGARRTGLGDRRIGAAAGELLRCGRESSRVMAG